MVSEKSQADDTTSIWLPYPFPQNFDFLHIHSSAILSWLWSSSLKKKKKWSVIAAVELCKQTEWQKAQIWYGAEGRFSVHFGSYDENGYWNKCDDVCIVQVTGSVMSNGGVLLL